MSMVTVDQALETILAKIKFKGVEKIPIGEFGEPDDIASMVLFLASDEAKHITGAQFVVDGGMQLNG